MTAFNWPNWREPSPFPPGQPFPGYLKQRRAAFKLIDHTRREDIRAKRHARRATAQPKVTP